MFCGAVGICGTILVLPSLYQGSPASIIAIEDFLQGAYAIYFALPANISVFVIIDKAFKAMEKWDGQELPEEEVFEAFYLDFRQLVDEKREGKLSTQLNYTKNRI